MKIACLATDGFEDDELEKPCDALRAAGHDVFVIGPKVGEIAGERRRVRIRADLDVDAADPRAFDALFVPGGFSPDRLRADPRFVRFVKDFDATARPVFAICHAAQLLLAAGVLEGRRVTAWRTVQDDLRRAGIEVVDEPVVVDDTLVTSREPGDIPDFIRAIERVLEREEIVHAAAASLSAEGPAAP